MRVPGTAGLVAAREIRSRTSSKSFRIGTLLSLLIVAALVVIPAVRSHHVRTFHVGVVGRTSEPLERAITATGGALGARVEVTTAPDVADARARLAAGQLDLVVVGGDRLLLDQGLTADSTTSLSSLVSAVSRAVALQAGLERAGIDPGRAFALAHPRPLAVGSLIPPPRHPVPLGTALVVTVLLFALLQQYGAWVLVGVVEEKASRVVEILLSAVRPTALLTGKVAGIGGVALLQAGLTVGVALGLSVVFGSTLLRGAGPAFIAVSMVWFLLGYAFYCWLFAAGGSLVSRQEDAQNVAFPLMLPLIFGYFLAFSAFLGGHASLLVRVFAFVPFTAPLEMPTLIALGEVTAWEVVLAMVITAASTVAMAALAARIYARAVLHTGRQLRLREVLPRRDPLASTAGHPS